MTRIHADDAAQLPITTDEQIVFRVEELLNGAIRRQWWTLFVDEDDHQLPLVMPMASYPNDPREPAEALDFLGRSMTAAELLAKRLRSIADDIDAASTIFVWERPGGPEASPADRRWADALGDACRNEGVHVRAQLLLHDDGARWFAPDDYLGASRD